MTREEAIQVLRDWDGYFIGHSSDDVNEALNIAIKALEPCEDTISRQAVLDAIMANCIWENEYNLTSSRIKKAVENLPPVTPEQKTGHWILTDVEGNIVWHCNCSECDKDPQDYIGGSENWWLIKNNLPKVCPNCGAKMQEVK